MPVSIVVQKRSDRLAFILDLIFTRMLGIEVSIVSLLGGNDTGPALVYGESGLDNAPHIHDSGLLWDNGYTYSSPTVSEQNGLVKLFFTEQFDLFSAVFWMVTEYDSYQTPSFDHHNRYLPSPIQQKLGLATQPIVHLWVAELEKELMTTWPELKAEQLKPAYPHQVTFDLDNPWKYLHKPLWVQMGGLAKATLTLRFEEVRERISSLLSRNDPNDTFDQIYAACPPEFTTFFILLEHLHANDSRFTWRHNRWKNRIREIASRGYSIGIHPSYLAMEIEGEIQQEKEYLEEIINESTSNTRMHFLRYRLPRTRREMIRAGIREDYTPYLNGTGGFPNGMMIPYPWFDLAENKLTELTLVPTILMDRTIVGTPESSRYDDQIVPSKEFNRLLTTINEGNGSFVLCLHNECLSESGEWKKWSSWFAEIIKTLKKQNEGGRP